MCFVGSNRLMKYRIDAMHSDLDSIALKCLRA